MNDGGEVCVEDPNVVPRCLGYQKPAASCKSEGILYYCAYRAGYVWNYYVHDNGSEEADRKFCESGGGKLCK